jgi:hypothetical protein
MDWRFFIANHLNLEARMIKPSLKEAKRFFKNYTVVPLCVEIFSDIRTPVEILKIFMSENKNVIR